MSRITLIIFLLAVTPLGVRAADLTVQILDQNGDPVSDVVVTYSPDDASSSENASGAQSTPEGSYEVSQKNIAFDPFVTLVPKGAEVTFMNEDTVLHHVFSFSKAKRFNLKLFGREEPQTVKFDEGGVVSIGCNIHDGMIAYINVVDAPYAAQSNGQGEVSLVGAPKGEGTLTVWHPLLKARKNTIQKSIAITDEMTPISIEEKFRSSVRAGIDY